MHEKTGGAVNGNLGNCLELNPFEDGILVGAGRCFRLGMPSLDVHIDILVVRTLLC